MSTPSHVVPIYHGPFKKDLYESYMMKYINENIITSNIDTTTETIEFMDLYHKYAVKTLEHLKNQPVPLKENPNNINIIFNKIWAHYPDMEAKYKGFGEFGEYANCFNGLPTSDGIQVDIKAIYKYFTTQAAQSAYEALLNFKKNFR